ncbi:MAX dimerization protein MGA a isoform X2 [Betta splendens]|uniref:MAX dimerization protein MGA a isoform X2 n=1 Tax=Betta splendens TaxID=158456 RepID=A0A6P7LJB9_BETSP|nr:MAX dimerization protein MGA a isoform X2 [Betta splendens]
MGANKNRCINSCEVTSGLGLCPTELKGKPSAGGTVTRLHMANIPPRPLGDPGQVKHGPAPKDSRVNTSVVRPVNPFMGSASSKASRVLMVEVLGSLGKVPVSGPSTPPTSQRMVLKPVHTASGVQFYRRPDGKLVQLVPVSQLKSGNPNPLLQKGPPSALPAAFLPTPSVTVVKQTQPLPSINSTISSAASLSGPRSSSGPLSSSLPPLSSGPLPQIGMCTFKILPAGSNKEPIIFTCPKAPMQHLTKVVPVLDSAPVTPVRLVSLQPSPGGGAGIGAKPVSVSPAPVGSGGLLASLELATSETPTEKAPLEAATSPPPSDRNSPEPEVACGLVDLDIICVDDETMEVVNVGGLSSSETENSSDFESDVEGDKEMMTTNLTHPAKPVRRLLHNVLERKRRGQIKQLFESLKKELGLNQEKTSKVSILKKAVQVIEELRAIHRQLDRKRRRLMDRRQKYLCTIGLTKEEKKQDLHRGRCLQEKQKTNKKQAVVEVVDLLDETDENTDNTSDEELVVTKTSDIITITSDKEDEVQCVAMGKGFGRLSSDCLMKTLEAPTDTKASRAPSSVLDTSNLTLLREKACEEIHPLQHQHRHSDLTKVCPGSGESEPMVPEKQQQQQDHNSALDEVQPSAADSKPPPIAKDTVDVITRASDQPQPPQRPPTPVSILTPVQQPHVVLQLTGPAPRLRDKTRTMPNILSRRKNRGEALSFHSLVPTEVLSLVGTALPGQPVLSLSPLIAGSAVLQTTSPATDLTNLLQLVQPQLQLQPQMLQVQHPSPLSRVATAGVDQDHTDCRPESSSLSSSHSIHNLWTSLGTGLSKPLDVVKEGAPEQQQETRGIAEVQNLTSLLDEINFLNQQTVTVATTVRVSSPVTQSKVNDHPHCSWIPQLESDSNDTVATEAQQIPGDQRTTTNSSKSSVLAPPPLLQMSVGGAKMAECSTGTGPAEGGGTEGGVAWRPMPRLVPLGLKGNQIS